MGAKNIIRLLTAAFTDDQNIDLHLQDSDELRLGAGTDVTMAWDGTDLDILAAADDSVIKFGNGTKSFDIWFYGNVAADYVLWDASASQLSFLGAATVRPVYTVTAKTANYTVAAADFGTIFTTRGAGAAVTFTLPAVTNNAGEWVEFYALANFNMIVAGPDEGLVVKNDLTADSIAYQTANEIIGGGFRAVCDGTSWIVVPLAEELQTVTIGSA